MMRTSINNHTNNLLGTDLHRRLIELDISNDLDYVIR